MIDLNAIEAHELLKLVKHHKKQGCNEDCDIILNVIGNIYSKILKRPLDEEEIGIFS